MYLSLHSVSFYSSKLGHPDSFSGDTEHPRWHPRQCGVGQRPEAADYFNQWPEAFEFYPPAHDLHQHSVPSPQGGHGWEPVLRRKILTEPKSTTWPSQSSLSRKPAYLSDSSLVPVSKLRYLTSKLLYPVLSPRCHWPRRNDSRKGKVKCFLFSLWGQIIMQDRSLWKSSDSAFYLLQLSKPKTSVVVEGGASLYIRLLSWALTGKRNVGKLLVSKAMALSPPSQPISHLNPRNSWENNSCHPQGSLAFFLDEWKSPLSLLTSCAGCIPRTPTKRNET